MNLFLLCFNPNLLIRSAHSEAYVGPCKRSMMEPYAKIVKGFWTLASFAKSFIVDVLPGPKYLSIQCPEAAALKAVQQMFFKKGVLKNFTKFTEKHLCWILFFIKLQFQHRCFPVNVAKLLRTAFFIEHL